MSIIRLFEEEILPAKRRLRRLMDRNYPDDYSVIPVRVTFKSGTTQTIEDGIVTECDHAGADMGDVDLANLIYNPDSGTVENIDSSQRALICDRCSAWKIPAGSEWYE